MSPIDKLSDILATKASAFSANPSDPENDEILRYGMYVLLADFAKTTILLTISYFMGLFTFTVLSILLVGFLKSFMGGVHSKTFWGCLITNTTLILLVSYISKSVLLQTDLTFLFTSFVVCVCAIFAYAPADIENKPIRDLKQRERLRNIALILAIAYLILAIYLRTSPYSVIIPFAYLINTLSLLPLMYKITKNRSGEFYDYENNTQNSHWSQNVLNKINLITNPYPNSVLCSNLALQGLSLTYVTINSNL